MATVYARQALLPEGWRNGVRIAFAEGRITDVWAGVEPAEDDERHRVVIPGMPNLHSHAFQRAMAGLTERRGAPVDSFWSWRTLMYRFALSMRPDQMEAIAAQLYVEMLEAGFTRVGEFHYLHNVPDGAQYANIAEMAERIAAASAAAGIGLTLLPVFYAHSDFGGAAPSHEQRRFILSVDGYARLMQACTAVVGRLPGARLGIAPHSLRAVTGVELATILPLAEGGPVHIHVAEQTREVEGCLEATGQRPVEWLADHVHLDGRWCLIHATHMTDAEAARVAASEAVVGLCPITEANLGDGVFDVTRFLNDGGRFGIGSDSNVLIGIPDELRLLEYGQRLVRRERNVIADAGGSVGRRLVDQGILGGNAALQSKIGVAPGNDADLIALSACPADCPGDDALLDRWIFTGHVEVDTVWAGGIKRVHQGRHIQRASIRRAFDKAMSELI